MTGGQVSDYAAAAVLSGNLSKPLQLLADRGNDPYWLKDAVRDKGIMPSIPAQTAHGQYDQRGPKCSNRIKIRVGRPRDEHGVTTRNHKLSKTGLSAAALAAAAGSWR